MWRTDYAGCRPKLFRPLPIHSALKDAIVTQHSRQQQTATLERDWAENPRWKGITRGYSAADVVRLRGSVEIEHTIARRGAEKLWQLVTTEPFVNALGA